MQAVAPLERTTKRFVIRQNIEHYRATLHSHDRSCAAGADRRVAREEEAKLKKYDDDNKKTPGSNKTA